jgi:S-formylglutathione hydrolase
MTRRAVSLLLLAAGAAAQSKLVEALLDTRLVPSPLEYAVLLPDGYEQAREALPLLLLLHGGGGSRQYLTQMRGVIDEMWQAGTLPKMVVATPSAARSFYMDYRDGSQRWETFVVAEFVAHLRKTYKVRADRRGTLLMGVSMGGLGSLRMAFKYPERFGAVAALEPGIEPALEWKNVEARHRFFRGPQLMETIYGKPMDPAWWAANNPATIADRQPEKLRGLAIYLECGDLDSFHLHEGAEFLHRVLWDRKIPHEYHLVRGADHVGRTLRGRHAEGLAFLARSLRDEPPDPAVETLKKQISAMIANYEKATGEKVRR